MDDPTFDQERRRSSQEWERYKKYFAEIPKDVILERIDDCVNHPPHYTNRKMEAIDIIELIIEVEKNPKVAYNLSNVVKYLLRFRDKGKPIEDLKKAQWYLNRMIEKLEEEYNEQEPKC